LRNFYTVIESPLPPDPERVPAGSARIVMYNPRVARRGYHRLPLSLLQCGVFLEGRYEYEIVDGNLEDGCPRVEFLLERLRVLGAKYLCVTIMPGPQLQQAIPDIRRVRAELPEVTIIVGGYFPSLNSAVCARHSAIDFVIDGPGEETLPELIDVLEAGGDPAGVRGVVFEGAGGLVHTPHRGPRDPNELPWFPYHRVNVEEYVVPTHLGSRTVSHHSSYGCPFKCNFCGVTGVANGRWMPESAVRVADIAEFFVREYGVNALEFHDNNFFTQQKRVLEFSRELLRRKLSLNWWGEGRIDTLLKYTPETWETMRDSGLKMIFMGAESGDDETLKRMNKGGTLKRKDSLALAALMGGYGIVPEFSFILGNPPEPRKDIESTIEFIRAIKDTNPLSEIIMYRYDPVPLHGEMMEAVAKTGFRHPDALDEWLDPKWAKVHGRRTADLPWLSSDDMDLIRNFETVLNAYYPTSTERRLHSPLTRAALKLTSGLRYHARLYRRPHELRLLQRLIRYQRPETSGF